MGINSYPPNMYAVRQAVAMLRSRGIPDLREFADTPGGDATAAIRAAMADTSVTADGRPCPGVFIPPGSWSVSEPIELDGRAFRMYGAGYSSRLVGNFPDFMFIKADNFVIVPDPSIRDLAIVNRHQLGGALALAGHHALVLDHVYLSAQRCFYRGVAGLPESGTLSTTLRDVTMRRGAGRYAGSYGIKTMSHIALLNCDAHDLEIGWQLGGLSANVYGGRTEVCGTGFVLGLDEDDNPNGWAGSVLEGHYFEACDTAIDVRAGGASRISCLFGNSSGSSNSPSRAPTYGLKFANCRDLTVEGVGTSGSFSRATIFVAEANQSITFRDCAPRSYNGHAWVVHKPSVCTFERCNVPAEILSSSRRQRRAMAATAPAGATYLDVAFPGAYAGWAAVITQATPGTGGELAAGSYFYYGCVVNEAGECAPAKDQGVPYVRQVTVGAGGSVALTFATNASPVGAWRRRVYRGTGIWGGDWATFREYMDLPPGPLASWVDTGAPFTATGAPRIGENANAGWPEADADYRVNVRPAWGTTAWVSDQTVNGFRINFGTPAPEGATLDWEIVR